MPNEGRTSTPKGRLTRRSVLKTAGLLSAGAAVGFMGPWRHNRIYVAPGKGLERGKP